MLAPTRLADHESVSEAAAEWMCGTLRDRPEALFCLATGGTPMRAYELFAQRCRADESLAAKMRVIKLDEWGGLPMDDPATCEQHLKPTLIGPLQLADRYVSFHSDPLDPQAEVERIGGWLSRHGRIDACVLGLGLNGHLGFNEPAEFLQPHAHVAQLSATSLSHSMINRTEIAPRYGLTLGMADLLKSRRILLLVTGAAKKETLNQLLLGNIVTAFPASLLHVHPDVTLLCDAAALGD